MKSFSSFIKVSALTVLAVFGLVACNKDGGETISADLRLVPDKTVIQPNGFDAVTFTVEYDGIDVTDQSSVFTEDGSPAGLTFTVDAAGSYGFYAEYNGERSETVTIVATSTMPEIPEDPQPESTDFARKALMMLFTSTDCSMCPYAIYALHQLASSPTRDQYVLVECHSVAKNDPAYYDGPLMSIYGGSVTPYVSVDMDNEELVQVGANPVASAAMSAYRSLVLRAAQLRPAKAGIAASSARVDNNVVVSMSVKVAETGEYKVGAWLLEDEIYGDQLNSGATGMDFNIHNDCLRYAQYTGSGKTADYTGVSLGTVNAGEEAGYTFSIPVEEGWNVENCHLVLLVTAEDGNAFYVNNVAACEIGGTVEYEYE